MIVTKEYVIISNSPTIATLLIPSRYKYLEDALKTRDDLRRLGYMANLIVDFHLFLSLEPENEQGNG